jgi:uncharacterized protein (DUF305 family)
MKTLAIFLMLGVVLVACSRKSDTAPNNDSTSSASRPAGMDSSMHAGGMSHPDSGMEMKGMMSGDMQKDMAMMNDMMVKGLDGGDSLYDHRFIDMMIPHHEGAIMMAKDAQQKANRPELKKLAESIIAGQQKEIDQMKQWRSKWYGENSSNGMANGSDMMKRMSMMNDMMVQKLGGKDSLYEDRFIDMMIPHHNGAVGMATDAIGKATHPEIKSLAKHIVDAQKGEIAEMEAWRKQWYGH